MRVLLDEYIYKPTEGRLIESPPTGQADAQAPVSPRLLPDLRAKGVVCQTRFVAAR
jgi:hypothetical protein